MKQKDAKHIFIDPGQGYVSWSLLKLGQFRRAYKACKGDSFTFEGHEFLKDYAKYLIEYLETQLGDAPIRLKGIKK